MERDPLAARSRFEKLRQLLFHLIVNLYGVQLSVRLQPLRKAESRIARIGTQFQNAPWAYHSRDHGQQTPLEMPGAHARIEMAQMGAAVEPAQMVGFGRDMAEDIIV